MNPWVKLLARAAAPLLLASFVAITVQGQQAGRSNVGIDRVIRERQRVFANKTLEEELRRPAAGREEPQLAVAQIKEDYVRIQLVNNDLARAAMQGGALDLKFVAKSTSEIKKRAERLKENLELPEPEKVHERPRAETGDGQEQLKASLLTLGKLVAGFVHNPIFREVNVVDVQMSARARRDLEEIIELSGRLKKDSEKLNKEAHKSH